MHRFARSVLSLVLSAASSVIGLCLPAAAQTYTGQPGQSVTIIGGFNPGVTTSGASVQFSLFPATGPALATVSAQANFTAGQPTTVAGTIALPANLTAGSYIVGVTISNSGGAALWSNASYGTVAVVYSSGSGGIKWHPGHYGLSLSRYTPNNVVNIHSDWTNILNSDARFVGVNGFYDWYHLEPTTQGVYDFSSIDNDIAWLNANFPGRKLLIEVWTRDFSGHSALPAVPQNTNYSWTSIPDYIVSGNFTGSGGLPGATWNSNGVLAAYWWSPVLARLQALDAALAARYDGNPTVEAIKYDEFEPPEPSSNASSYGATMTGMQNTWETLHQTMAADWPTTNKALYANWPPYFLSGTSIFSSVWSLGVGVGGPDTLPPASQGGTGETWGEQALRGVNPYGSIDYRGTLPIVYEAENPVNAITVPNLESYEYGTLKATHMSWLYNPVNMGTSSWTVGAGTTPWKTNSSHNPNNYPGVVDTLQSMSFRINSACPSKYANGCNPN